MTKKIAVSLPDDVADWLGRHDNVSAAVTDAVRARMNAGQYVREQLSMLGVQVSEAGLARWRAALYGGEQQPAEKGHHGHAA